ncbi:uncharacterized protein Hap1MRO34_004426 isoform 1-T1 [Clarias gariepinus]
MFQGNPIMKKNYVMVLGNTMNSHKTFLEALTSKRGSDITSLKLCEVSSSDNSDVIIAFVPIASRAGTDISNAMEKIPKEKPVVLVVLHHTFDPEHIAPDSRLRVNNERVFVVDCLFHEDKGLLKCPRNDDAIRAVKEHLMKGTNTEMQQSMTHQEEENQQLLQQNRTHEEPQHQRTVNLKMMICILFGVSVFVGIVVVIGLIIRRIVFPHFSNSSSLN